MLLQFAGMNDTAMVVVTAISSLVALDYTLLLQPVSAAEWALVCRMGGVR
jgi:hypothetical protein